MAWTTLARPEACKSWGCGVKQSGQSLDAAVPSARSVPGSALSSRVEIWGQRPGRRLGAPEEIPDHVRSLQGGPPICAPQGLRPHNRKQKPWVEPRQRRLLREKPAGAEIQTTLSHSTDVRGISTSPPPPIRNGQAWEGRSLGRGAASGRALSAAPRWQTRGGGAVPPSGFNSALKGKVEVESDPRPGLAGPRGPQGPPAGPACASNGPARRTRAHWTGSSPGSPTVQQGFSCILTGKPGN